MPSRAFAGIFCLPYLKFWLYRILARSCRWQFCTLLACAPYIVYNRAAIYCFFYDAVRLHFSPHIRIASLIYLVAAMVFCDFMATAKNKYDWYKGMEADIRKAVVDVRDEEGRLGHNLLFKIKELNSEILESYSNKLGRLAAEIIEKASNGSDNTKMQFDLLMSLYRFGNRSERNYFEKYDMVDHFKHYGNIKYLSSYYDANYLDREGLDIDLLQGLVERTTVGADECKSGTNIYYTTPLGYHVASMIYLRALAEPKYKGILEDDLEKAFDRISAVNMLFMGEIKLFVTPRKEVVDLVKKVLEDAGSAVKKDLDGVEPDRLDYLAMRKVEEFMVNLWNEINLITKEYSEADMDQVQEEHALKLKGWISDIYESLASNKLLLSSNALRR